MSIIDELKRLTRPYEDEEDDEMYEEEEKTPSLDEERRRSRHVADADFTSVKPSSSRYGAKDKVVNIHTTTQLKVVLVKPVEFNDASIIADHLRDKRTVVMNLEAAGDAQTRLLDFLSGVTYAQEGKIQKVAEGIYVITPYNVDVIGDLVDELENNGIHF